MPGFASLTVTLGRVEATKPGAVVFLAAEGAAGFRKRIVAHRQYHGITQPIPFYMIANAPDLGHTPGDVDRLIEAIGAAVEWTRRPHRRRYTGQMHAWRG